jgi:hypothetical protein
MRPDDQAKLTTMVSACLEYLTTATNSSPLAQLAREALLKELNALQVILARTPRLVELPRREPAKASLFTCPYCGGPVDQDPAIAPPPPVDTAPPMPHTWTPAELREAVRLLPDGIFAGHYFDRVGQQVTGQPHVGVSLQKALTVGGAVVSFGVNDQGDEDTRGPYLRFRKV